uniref:Protein TOPAZ1 n=1 Tax=Myripristis murdjan TaxID=586833 RepID=A0A667XAY7_9TELE
MFPASGRVKLNRATLKDVIGLQLVPRRRRVSKALTTADLPATPQKTQDRQRLMENPVSIPGEFVRPCSSDQMVPETVTDTYVGAPKSGPSFSQTDGEGTRLPERSSPCKRTGIDLDTKHEGPYTREINRKRNVCPKPAGLTGSEQSVRRALIASSYGLCGHCEKNTSLWMNLGKEGPESTSPGLKQLVPPCKTKKANTVIQTPICKTPAKIITWIGKNPMVKLCDVVQKCDVCCHKCGYVLPDVLKTKVVHCFKQDLNAEVRFRPRCSGYDKHRGGESTVAKSSDSCHSFGSDKNSSQPQSLTELQKKYTKENPTAETFINHANHCPYLDVWTTEASANCSASLSLGECTSKGQCMLDRDIEEDPVAESDVVAPERRKVKRLRLGDSIRDGILQSSPSLESSTQNELTETHVGDKRKESSMAVNSQLCLDLSTGSMHVNKSAQEESGDQNGDPGKDDAAQNSSELVSQKNGVGHHSNNTDQLEQFSCQRARVYFRRIYFSCARTDMPWPFPHKGLTNQMPAGSDACLTEPVPQFPKYCTDAAVNQNQDSVYSLDRRTTGMLSSVASGSSSGTNQWISSHKKYERGKDVRWGREEDVGLIVSEKNGEGLGNQCLYSSDSIKPQHAFLFQEGEKPQSVSLPSDVAVFCPLREQREPGTGRVLVPSTPSDGSETDKQLSASSTSTPSPARLGDWQMASSFTPMLSSFTLDDSDTRSTTPSSLPNSFPQSHENGAVSVHTSHTSSSSPKHLVETSLLCYKTHMTSPRYTQCCTPPPNSESFHSCASSLILSQEEQETEEYTLTESSLKPEQHCQPSPSDSDLADVFGKESPSLISSTERWLEIGLNVFIPPPVLSPIASPQRHSSTNLLPQTHEEDKEQSQHKLLSGNQMPKMATAVTGTRGWSVVHENIEDCKDGGLQTHEELTNGDLEQVDPDFKMKESLTTYGLKEPQSRFSNDEDAGDCNEEIDQDYPEDVEQGNRNSEVSSNPKIQATLNTAVLTEPHSSPSSDGDDRSYDDEAQSQTSGGGGCSPETSVSEREEAEAADDDDKAHLLDEFTAYEQDILLVDVIQDDPDLFGNVPKQSLLRLGPTRVSEAPHASAVGDVRAPSSSLQTEQRSGTVAAELLVHIEAEESNKRPWRPQSGSSPLQMHSTDWPPTNNQTKTMEKEDANNNDVKDDFERSQAIQTVGPLHNTIPQLMSFGSGPWIKNPSNMTDWRRQKSSAYCRLYFSETLSCTFKICRFQHVPIEGDEKFCIETVTRFTQNPLCLPKAGAVFTGYYQNNPPGVYFSMPVLISLLWALLKAGLLPTLFSVLNASVAHRIMPGPEFLLALFNFVRERGLMGFVPELMQLTAKMTDAGLVLSSDYAELQKTQESHQKNPLNASTQMSDNHKLSPSTSVPFPETLNLAHAIVEIELCTKQEDWRRMGVVFRSICQSNQVPNKLELISGRIAVALLSETKNKLSLPFAAFAEMVYQDEGENSLIRSYLGRIGVSLMLRYHKTHQWAKGQKVVEVLSKSKVSYSKLKGLFGNEDGASRCCLVTMATELFLLNGSVEGALNTLRENEWFIRSPLWPSNPDDLEKRCHVLMRLAEKTSQRDTLEVLSNLPGLKEPSDALCGGYYPGVSAPPGLLALTVPCRLGEIEMALTFEMFIMVNATVILNTTEATSCLSVTLTRTQNCERKYLSAGSRLLSAACLPQPRLSVRYTAVNSSQEQVFILDASSARRWLRHNHLWASEVWSHSSKQ